MTSLLIHQAAHDRVRDRLAEMPGIEPIVFADDGTLSMAGGTVPPDRARPDLTWFSTDLYVCPETASYMDLMRQASGLQWVHVSAAGLENPVYRELAERGVRLTTNHTHAIAIAEYVLAGVLDHYQNGPERRAQRTERVWKPGFFRELMDARWLIVGLGSIGQAVAVRAKGFGAHVTGIRRDMAPHPHADELAPLDALHEFLPAADIVVLCMPLKEATRDIVDAGFLAAMKQGSVLVNVGRGALVDEGALLAALDRGKPEHAVLDVFRTEPLPADSPFWDHPRVALTAHTSGLTSKFFVRNDELFLENLERYLAGENLLHEATADDI